MGKILTTSQEFCPLFSRRRLKAEEGKAKSKTERRNKLRFVRYKQGDFCGIRQEMS
jgi:hypothetical protein